MVIRLLTLPVLVFLTSALLVLASSDIVMAQELPKRSTPTPEAKKSNQVDTNREASRSQQSTSTPEARRSKQSNLEPVEAAAGSRLGFSDTPTPISIFLEEKITVGNNSAKSGESVRQNVIVTHTVDIKTSALSTTTPSDALPVEQNDSDDFSSCRSQSGGRSSIGSIGLLTAPLALYAWRRMQKF